jgi:hypothetical protein
VVQCVWENTLSLLFSFYSSKGTKLTQTFHKSFPLFLSLPVEIWVSLCLIPITENDNSLHWTMTPYGNATMKPRTMEGSPGDSKWFNRNITDDIMMINITITVCKRIVLDALRAVMIGCAKSGHDSRSENSTPAWVIGCTSHVFIPTILYMHN